MASAPNYESTAAAVGMQLKGNTGRPRVSDHAGDAPRQRADRVFSLFKDLVAKGRILLMVTHSRSLAAEIQRVIEVIDGNLFETNGSEPGV